MLELDSSHQPHFGEVGVRTGTYTFHLNYYLKAHLCACFMQESAEMQWVYS